MATTIQAQSPAASNGPTSNPSAAGVPQGVVAKEYYKFAREIPGVDPIELKAFCSEEMYWTSDDKLIVIIAGANGKVQPGINCFVAEESSWSCSTWTEGNEIKSDPSKLDEFLRTGPDTCWRIGAFDFSDNRSIKRKEHFYVSLKIHPSIAWILLHGHRWLSNFKSVWVRPRPDDEVNSVPNKWARLMSMDLLNPFAGPAQGSSLHTLDGVYARIDFPNSGSEAICLLPAPTYTTGPPATGVLISHLQSPNVGLDTSINDLHYRLLELFLDAGFPGPKPLPETIVLRTKSANLPFVAMDWLWQELRRTTELSFEARSRMERDSRCGRGLLECADIAQQGRDSFEKVVDASFRDCSPRLDMRLKQRLDRFQRQKDYYLKNAERIKQRLDFENLWFSSQMAESTIHEAKFAKTVTVLAFIFLPVSISTSVFGMNLQQLNDSGKDVSAFIVTAILLIVTTLILWVMSIKFSRWRQKVISQKSFHQSLWRNVRADFLSDPLNRVGLLQGLALLLYFPISWTIRRAVKALRDRKDKASMAAQPSDYEMSIG